MTGKNLPARMKEKEEKKKRGKKRGKKKGEKEKGWFFSFSFPSCYLSLIPLPFPFYCRSLPVTGEVLHGYSLFTYKIL
jgi:hypothetical protein